MGRGGRRNPDEYVTIVAEVFECPERRRGRLRPIEGQVYPADMYIECSKQVRALPFGTLVEIRVVETEKEDSRKFLYSSYKWPVNILGGGHV